MRIHLAERGRTYGNNCTRQQRKVAKAYDGACKGPSPF